MFDGDEMLIFARVHMGDIIIFARVTYYSHVCTWVALC
jgi:hypothetical protein